MYAIVKTGGKQYRVEKGQTLLVERLPDDAGATVSLEPILFRSDEVVFEADALSKVSVDARVVEHVRGQKLRVFKFKPKRGYRKRTGHRQELTRIEVTDIAGPGSKRRESRRSSGAKTDERSKPDAASQSEAGSEQAFDARGKSVTEVTEWITSDKPNVQQTVAAANDDPDAAATLLEAERVSHDGDGRTTVIDPLQRIVERAVEADESQTTEEGKD